MLTMNCPCPLRAISKLLRARVTPRTRDAFKHNAAVLSR